jgi:ketosteroid isomerase-like protein
MGGSFFPNFKEDNMKQAIAGCLLALSLHACSDKPRRPDNEALVRRCFALFNQHDWEGMAALYADTAVFKDPSLGPGLQRQTRAQTVAKYRNLQKELPDVHDSLVQLYTAGPQHVVAEFVSTGTLPDGSRLQLPICTVFTIQNGQIVADHTYYDNP